MPSRPGRSLVIAMPPSSTTASATADPMAPAEPVTSTTFSLRRPMPLASPSVLQRTVSDVSEIAVAPFARGKPRRAGDTLALDHPGRAGPFGPQTFGFGKPFLEADRALVRAQAF